MHGTAVSRALRLALLAISLGSNACSTTPIATPSVPFPALPAVVLDYQKAPSATTGQDLLQEFVQRYQRLLQDLDRALSEALLPPIPSQPAPTGQSSSAR